MHQPTQLISITFQTSMLQSVDRFIKFLTLNDMGPSNPTMRQFMETATTRYLFNLHEVKLEIDSNGLDNDEWAGQCTTQQSRKSHTRTQVRHPTRTCRHTKKNRGFSQQPKN